MVKNLVGRQLLKDKARTLTDSEVAEVLEYIAIMQSMGKQANQLDPLDEVIAKLLFEAMISRQGDGKLNTEANNAAQ